jgi:hypothetical protein
MAKGRPEKLIDPTKYALATRGLDKLNLSYGKRLEIREDVRHQVRELNMNPADELDLVKTFEMFERDRMVRDRLEIAEENAARNVRGRNVSADVNALLNAKSVEEIQRICPRAFRPVRAEVRTGQWRTLELPRWPIEVGSAFPYYLSQHAAQFLAAKDEPRYPGSNRPSSEPKRLWFVSCALASAVMGLETRTAINMLGSKPPDAILKVYF